MKLGKLHSELKTQLCSRNFVPCFRLVKLTKQFIFFLHLFQFMPVSFQLFFQDCFNARLVPFGPCMRGQAKPAVIGEKIKIKRFADFHQQIGIN